MSISIRSASLATTLAMLTITNNLVAGFIAAPPAPERDEFAARSNVADENLALQALRRQQFLDPANPSAAQLQRPEEALRDLPHDKLGFVDWNKALKEGRIAPRASLQGDTKMQSYEADSIMRNTREMPYVRFPHGTHTQWLSCDACHPAPFEARAGANSIDMTKIFRGHYCGKCHDRVAFVTSYACERCHSVAQSAKQP